MPARGDCKRRESTGMFKYAEVVPWCDWEHQEGQLYTATNTHSILTLVKVGHDRHAHIYNCKKTQGQPIHVRLCASVSVRLKQTTAFLLC